MNDEKIIELTNNIIDYWEEDTMNLSFNNRNHPAFSIVKHLIDKEWYKDIVITTILKRMKKEITHFFCFLGYTLTEKELPKIPDEAKGKIEKINEIYLKWGKEKGYLNDN